MYSRVPASNMPRRTLEPWRPSVVSEGAVPSEAEAGVTVLIPARDEEQGIAVTLEMLRAVEPRLGRPLEILVIDDGSMDATRAIAEQAGARVCVHPRSGGYGRSLKTGVENARHELIAIPHAAGTY